MLVLSLVACGSKIDSEPQSTANNSTADDFANAITVEINDTIRQNCESYAKSLGYETGDFQRAILLDNTWIDAVHCDDDTKKDLLDEKDILVIFENIRCVVDKDTDIVLGRIPYV